MTSIRKSSSGHHGLHWAVATSLVLCAALLMPSEVHGGKNTKGGPGAIRTPGGQSLRLQQGGAKCPYPPEFFGDARKHELEKYKEAFMDILMSTPAAQADPTDPIRGLTDDLNRRITGILQIYEIRNDDIIVREEVRFDQKGARNGRGVTVGYFLDRITTCASQNPFLTEALGYIWEERGKYYTKKSTEEIAEALSQAVAYARVLDSMTNSVRNDFTIIPRLKEVFFNKLNKQMVINKYPNSIYAPLNPVRRAIKTYLTKKSLPTGSLTNSFEKVKIIGVENGMLGIFNRLSKGAVEDNLFADAMSINVLEAVAEDYRLLNFDNGDAGRHMTSNGPSYANNMFMGARPAKLSDDKKAFQLFANLPKQWADLYSTWNMAFVSHYPNAHLFWGKLFNPQVLCYENEPSEYMYNRVTALWLHINYEYFNRIERGAAEYPDQWNDPELTRTWSLINKRNGQAYEDDVSVCKAENEGSLVVPPLMLIHRVERKVAEFRETFQAAGEGQKKSAFRALNEEIQRKKNEIPAGGNDDYPTAAVPSSGGNGDETARAAGEVGQQNYNDLDTSSASFSFSDESEPEEPSSDVDDVNSAADEEDGMSVWLLDDFTENDFEVPETSSGDYSSYDDEEDLEGSSTEYSSTN